MAEFEETNRVEETDGSDGSSAIDAARPDIEQTSIPEAGVSLESQVSPPESPPRPRAKLTPGAILFGILITAGLAAFVLLARVTVHPFDKLDRKMRVIDVWIRLRNHLPDVAHPTILGIVFDLSIAFVVVGSLACIWLALMSTDEPLIAIESPKPREPVAANDSPALQTGR
jgi:hypothetical protein